MTYLQHRRIWFRLLAMGKGCWNYTDLIPHWTYNVLSSKLKSVYRPLLSDIHATSASSLVLDFTIPPILLQYFVCNSFCWINQNGVRHAIKWLYVYMYIIWIDELWYGLLYILNEFDWAYFFVFWLMKFSLRTQCRLKRIIFPRFTIIEVLAHLSRLTSKRRKYKLLTNISRKSVPPLPNRNVSVGHSQIQEQPT